MKKIGDKIKYPVGVQSFSKLREMGYLYIDKTDLIYELIRRSGYYFLSRPRRFGKSLLLSTIEAYYQGRRDLFKGLALDTLIDDWTPHPVLHLDLNADTYDKEDSVEIVLDLKLKEWEREYDISVASNATLAYRFGEVISSARRISGQRVVILIDEYDKPILNAINNTKIADHYRTTLKAFYGILKSKDEDIEFAMMTGVARFSKVSIFSDLNNLKDISFQRDFSTICGITPADMEMYLKPGIERLASDNEWSFEKTIQELKKWYDGYHFSLKLEDVYNPYSLMSVFDSNEISNYWYATGTPTYLTHLLRKDSVDLDKIQNYKINPRTLNSIGLMSKDPIITLFQTGYLTVKYYDKKTDLVSLNYPNREVKESFLRFLMPYYTQIEETQADFEISKFAEDVKEGKPESFMKRLSHLIARVPYGGKGVVPEDHFQNAIYLVFTLMGYISNLETRTSNGRIDMVVETTDYLYIFEFKVDKSAEVALAQIREHQYWKGYESSGKTIYLIGANFDSIKRELDEFVIETNKKLSE